MGSYLGTVRNTAKDTATAVLLSKRSLSVGRTGQDSPEQEPMSFQALPSSCRDGVTSYLQAASSRLCLFQKPSDEIRLQPAIHRPWVSGGQWCSHREGAMRGRRVRRIAEHQGSRGLDVLSGVWGAHSAVSSLGKSHPSHLGPFVRARRLGAVQVHQPERLHSSRQTNDSVRGTNVSTIGFDRCRGPPSNTTLTACRCYAIMWGGGDGDRERSSAPEQA